MSPTVASIHKGRVTAGQQVCSEGAIPTREYVEGYSSDPVKGS